MSRFANSKTIFLKGRVLSLAMSTPWVRGLIFTMLVPVMIGAVVPALIEWGGGLAGGLWQAGWVLIATGAVIYTLCFLRFLAAAGTPAIFFTRHIRFLIGEEPQKLVSTGLYRFSRNPMYVGVVVAIFGRALVSRSLIVAIYGGAVFVFFHAAVVLLEEPHLRRTLGEAYRQYCEKVPRWL
jgi:protein-S-isoprenylcysteine O-methyltransferase Ste14